MNGFESFLIDAAKYGIWDIISVLVLFFSFLIAIRFLFFPFYKVRNLNFYVTHNRDQSNYPSKLFIEIRNFTNKNLVLSNTYFKSKKLIPHPNARGDTALKRFELKFDPNYTSPDCLIIHGNTCLTWFPIDPNQPDEEIQAILHPTKIGFFIFKCTPRRAGNFDCKCTFLTKKPRTVRLIRRY
jgi:hypothetical protein